MLQDDRAKSLAIDFGGQMFGFTGFEEYNVPDPERFPEFTPQIRAAMLQEVIEFLDHVIRKGAPVSDLLAANYSFLNGNLARHYGIEHIGDQFQKVELPANRGGLASMGLFLTKTSEPLRTSPVVRGTWVYEALLGHELPSPPANIPSISQDETDDKGRSIREQLEFHRADAGCASCHNKIDPLGVALEQFDPVGRWRTKLRDGSKPDVVATTKDGVNLNGAQSLKHYLASQEHRLVEHLTRKLLGYALGRSTQTADKFLLDRLIQDLPKQKNQFQWLVEEIVLSPQFRNRRD